MKKNKIIYSLLLVMVIGSIGFFIVNNLNQKINYISIEESYPPEIQPILKENIKKIQVRKNYLEISFTIPKDTYFSSYDIQGNSISLFHTSKKDAELKVDTSPVSDIMITQVNAKNYLLRVPLNFFDRKNPINLNVKKI